MNSNSNHNSACFRWCIPLPHSFQKNNLLDQQNVKRWQILKRYNTFITKEPTQDKLPVHSNVISVNIHISINAAMSIFNSKTDVTFYKRKFHQTFLFLCHHHMFEKAHLIMITILCTMTVLVLVIFDGDRLCTDHNSCLPQEKFSCCNQS